MLLPAHRTALARAAVAVLAVAVYIGTLGHGFVFDDEIVVTQQQVVRSHRLGDVFTTPYHAGTGGTAGTGLYRPVPVLTYVAQNALHGLRPAAFHAVNVALHAIVSLLVFELAIALALPLAAALFASALFALHPVHVEAVAGIAGRPEILCALFFLLALILYLRVPGWPGLSVAALALLLALGSKETAIVFPLVAIGAQLLPRRRHAILPTVVALAIPIALYLAARALVLGSLFVPMASVSKIENPVVGLSMLERLPTVLAMGARYAVLLVFPWHLSPDWGFAEVTRIASLDDPWLISGALLALVAAAGAVVALRRNPTIAFCLLLGASAWFITSNLPMVIGVGMAERLLYLPSVAFCLLVAFLGIAVHRKIGGATAAAVAIAVLLAAGARTWTGAAVWRDELTLFTDAERHAPRSVKVLGNLGAQLAAEGHYEQARRRLERAAAIAPDVVAITINLAGVLLNLGEFEAAEKMARHGLEVDPHDGVLHVQLGAILLKQHRLADSEAEFRTAVELDPAFIRARLDLASALLNRGATVEARRQLEAVLALDPGSAAARRGLDIADELERQHTVPTPPKD